MSKQAQALRLEWRTPAELDDNPKNWRRHPDAQTRALRDVIGEVGWAGALLYNERTKKLIDGHARKKIAKKGEKVPVLIGSWSEKDEAKILATLDPLAALAERDDAAWQALLADVETGSTALMEMLQMPVFDIDGTDAPILPDGDRAPFQQMTFTLHDEQVEEVKAALKKAEALGPFVESPNENSNGNALARVCEVFLGTS